MESTSSVASIPAYPSMLDRCDGAPTHDSSIQSDSDIFTQPVARKPIDPQRGGTGRDDGAIEAFERQPDERAPRRPYL
jgi:hypothetical protein